jgi:hypothetical protein
MAFHALFGVGAAFWLISIMACVLAFRWSFLSVRRRFLPAVILAISALVIGYLGMTRFHIVYSKTVNGQLRWRFDSRWFFIVPLVLGVTALAYCHRSDHEGPAWVGRGPFW